MPKFDVVNFTDQNQIDSMNATMRVGLKIIPFSHQGNLVAYKSNIDNLLNVLTPEIDDPNTIAILENLPVTEIEELDTQEQLNASQLVLAPLGQWKFCLEGSSSAAGKFMTVASKAGIPSNTTPAVLPAKLHVVSMIWMNEIDHTNERIELFLNGGVLYTWILNDCRYAVINAIDEFTPLVALPEMGLLSAKITNTGAAIAKDGYLEVIFRLIGKATPGEFVSPVLT